MDRLSCLNNPRLLIATDFISLHFRPVTQKYKWPVLLNSSLSMYYSVGICNSSFNCTTFSEVDNPFVWNSKEIARLINIIVRPILVVLCTIGNGLSFFIMRRSSLKNLSTCFYMSILALTDTGKFLTVFKRP